MRAVDQEEFLGQAADLLALVEAGEAILVKRGDRVIAKVIPVSPAVPLESSDDNAVAPADEVEQAFYGD